MPFTAIAQFEKSFPQVKSLTPEQKQKALDMFNAIMENDPEMDEGRAIAIVLSRVKNDESLSDSYYSMNLVELSEDSNGSVVEVLRAGVIRDRGLKITKKMLSDFVSNFDSNVYGTELQVNLGHNREGEAAGWIKRLFVDGEKLNAEVEWTPLGKEKLKDKLYKFVSAEFADRFPHHTSGKLFKNVFTGLALTNVPALKGQSAISLSEEITLTNDTNMSEEKLPEEEKKEEAPVEEGVETPEEKPEVAPEATEAPESEEKPEGEVTEGEEKEEDLEAEEKAEEAPAEEPAEEEKAEEAPVETAELSESAGKVRLLSEQLAEKEAKLVELAEKLEMKELSEKFEKEMLLSEETGVGFLGASKDKVVSFLMELSQEQRGKFEELLSEVRAADLSVKGSSEAVDVTEKEEKMVALADQLLEEGKAKDIFEAQKLARIELNK